MDQLLKAIWEKVIDCLFFLNDEGLFTNVNASFCKFFNKKNDEIIGENFFSIFTSIYEDSTNTKITDISFFLNALKNVKIDVATVTYKWLGITMLDIGGLNQNIKYCGIIKDFSTFYDTKKELEEEKKNFKCNFEIYWGRVNNYKQQ